MTCSLAGSAINFPDGNQDDVVALGALAARYNIGLHVNCCLGLLVVPFLEQTGLVEGENDRYKLALFDFRVRGVIGISDTHKVRFTSFHFALWRRSQGVCLIIWICTQGKLEVWFARLVSSSRLRDIGIFCNYVPRCCA